MNPDVNAIVIAVENLERSKKFYGDGLGCAIDKDYKVFVTFKLGGSLELGLYTWEALAGDAGISPKRSDGFRGVTFHTIVDSTKKVDELLAKAERAGGKIVRPAAKAQWGGYFGYFSDPDGHLWKVATQAE